VIDDSNTDIDEAERQERARRIKNAFYSFMVQEQAATTFGVSHEDYMKWSFDAVNEMTPEGRAIMEAHEAKIVRETQSQGERGKSEPV
jgi:hypothetical protein